MARKCDICQKGKLSGNNVSFSVNRTKKHFKPNIQKVRVEIDGRTERLNVCTRCLRSGKVKKSL